MTNRSSLTKALMAVSIAATTALGLSACGGGTSDADLSFLTQLGDPQGKVMPTGQAIEAAHSFCDKLDNGSPVEAGLKLFSQYPAVVGYQNNKFTDASIGAYCPQHKKDIEQLRQSSGDADTAGGTSAPKPAAKTLREGQEITYTDDGDGSGPTTFKVHLDNIDQMTSASGYGPDSMDFEPTKAEKGQFVVLEMTVTDLTGPQDGMFLTQPYYVGADGQRLDNPSTNGVDLKGISDRGQDINQKMLAPGQHASGNMVFDVPNANGKIVIPNEDNTPAFEIPLTPVSG